MSGIDSSRAAARALGGFLAPALVTLLLAASPDTFAASGVDPELDIYARPQRLVRLDDGRQMNVFCQGSGSPTVLLEAGAGGSTLEWRWVQSEIAKSTRVCAYDRAGMGFSDAGKLPRTAQAVVADLIALLKAAKIDPPYVMVGHSLGSYYVRLYTDHHLSDVVGMVLVDPSVEYQDTRFAKVSPQFMDSIRQDEKAASECLHLAEAGKLTADLPIFKECTYGYSRDPHFSDELFGVQIKRRLSVNFRATLLSETREMDGTDSEELVAAHRSYGSMPLIVLTQSAESADAPPGVAAEQANAMNELWIGMHEELAALSSRGSHRQVEHSGHYIQRDRPDVVIEAVREVVGEARHASLSGDARSRPIEQHLKIG